MSVLSDHVRRGDPDVGEVEAIALIEVVDQFAYVAGYAELPGKTSRPARAPIHGQTAFYDRPRRGICLIRLGRSAGVGWGVGVDRALRDQLEIVG